MPEFEDIINFDEEVERSHIDNLREFKEKVYPLYQRNGFTLPQALTVWQLQGIQNSLFDLIDRSI